MSEVEIKDDAWLAFHGDANDTNPHPCDAEVIEHIRALQEAVLSHRRIDKMQSERISELEAQNDQLVSSNQSLRSERDTLQGQVNTLAEQVSVANRRADEATAAAVKTEG